MPLLGIYRAIYELFPRMSFQKPSRGADMRRHVTSARRADATASRRADGDATQKPSRKQARI